MKGLQRNLSRTGGRRLFARRVAGTLVVGTGVLALLVTSWGCATPSYARPGWGSHGDAAWGYGYDGSGRYGERWAEPDRYRHDPGARLLARHQRAERHALAREQAHDRRALRREQRAERRERKQAGAWDREAKRELKQERREQRQSFRHERHELRHHQRHEWWDYRHRW